MSDKLPVKASGAHVSDQEAQAFLKAWTENGQNATAAYCATRTPPITEMTKAVAGRVTVYMKRPTIAKLIAEAKAKAADKIGGVLDRYAVSEERIVEELASIAFSKVTDILEWGPEGVKVKSSADLADHRVTAAIAEISEVDGVIKVKLSDKKAALEALARYRGMFTERRETLNKNVSVSFVIDRSEDASITRNTTIKVSDRPRISGPDSGTEETPSRAPPRRIGGEGS